MSGFPIPPSSEGRREADRRVRHARERDRDEIVRMRQSLWPDSTREEVHRLLSDVPEPEGAILVVERADGSLGGFAEIAARAWAEGCSTSPVAYVEGIWVDPDLRRARVGAALIRAAEAWATGRGLSEIASDASLENRVSQAFHVQCGFAEVERIVCYRKSLGSSPGRPE